MSPVWIALPLVFIVSVIILVVILVSTVVSYVLSLPPGVVVSTADLLALPGVVSTLAVFGVVIFAVNILLAWMTYKLVRRRNTHFGRQFFFYEDVKSVAAELVTKKGADASAPLNNLDRIGREARLDETQKNPVLWVALTLASTSIPSVAILKSTGSMVGLLPVLASLYVYYFLMKDFYRHERREDQFIRDLLGALAISGFSVSLPYRNPPLPERSFPLYLVLSVVTVGFFWVYWVHVLLNDPNNHFRQQMLIEDTIMAQLSGPMIAPTPVPSTPPS
jgi:hypothetical protein